MKVSNHDTIVGFIAGKMQNLGFMIKFMEGDHASVVIDKPALPPQLCTHRPDVFGVEPSGIICIGEAKMPSDLNTRRTKIQIIEFVKLVRAHPGNLLIFGIPFGAKDRLITLLNSLGIILDQQIDIMEIPLQFLPLNAATI
jgi:hypothetical protein